MSEVHKCSDAIFPICKPSSLSQGSAASPRRRRDWRLSIGAEPHHPRARGAAWRPVAGAHDTQRVADEAGQRILDTIGPRLDEIETELVSLGELRTSPAGKIRITTGEHAAHTVLWPALQKLLPKYPDIEVELIIDYGLTDIVAERFEAGVRLGEQIAKDMIAVRIGPDLRMAVVGAPSYFARRPRPTRPQDLTSHACINLRLPTYDNVFAWEFEKDGREIKVHVEGQLTFNSLALRLNATVAGLGEAYLPVDQVRKLIRDGKLVRVLADWCPRFAGYHFYYPSRRQATPAFGVLVDALRYRGS